MPSGPKWSGGRHGRDTYNQSVDLEKTLLRKTGEAIARFRMIREGDRVAVALSGGKDSATLLEALLLLSKRAPIHFSVCAFTVEQGKFLRPIEPLGEYLKARGVAWTYYRDTPSLRLLEEQPDHGCDVCSRFRRRAVYEIAHHLSANVIAFGHTADDFCEALLRNTMFTGKLSALPPVTFSRDREYRLIRPLVYVTEDITRAYAEAQGVPVVPCGCSQKTGTVRRALRDMFGELEREHPHLKENILSAMGNLDTSRLLDTRFLDLDGDEPAEPAPELLPILTNNV
jgi:tRNA 2-thiocytidine biosynthesis protein TtcA